MSIRFWRSRQLPPTPVVLNKQLDVPDFKLHYHEDRLEHIEMYPNWTTSSGVQLSHVGADIFCAVSDHYPILKQWRHHSHYSIGWIHTYSPLPPMTLENIIYYVLSTQAEITEMLDDYIWFKNMAQYCKSEQSK